MGSARRELASDGRKQEAEAPYLEVGLVHALLGDDAHLDVGRLLLRAPLRERELRRDRLLLQAARRTSPEPVKGREGGGASGSRGPRTLSRSGEAQAHGTPTAGSRALRTWDDTEGRPGR